MRHIKRIIFVEPLAPGYHVYSMVKLPRLGLPILGAILKKAGYEVEIFHEESSGIDLDELLRADAIGISTITSTSIRAYSLAEAIREMSQIPVFMGGPHATFCYEEALQHCDYVIRGEAESIILDFIKALEAQEGFEKIPGLCYRKDGIIHVNKMVPMVIDMNTYPDPDYSIYPKLPFNSVAPVMTSRGCPFDCEFCSVTTMFGRKYRLYSIDRCISQIKAVLNTGAKYIFFYDDNFNANPKRTFALLKRIIKEKLKFKWGAQVRVDIARNPELLDLAKEAGAEMFYIGFESINPETLKAFNKKQTLEDIMKAIRAIRSRGIGIHGMFVIGEDHDDVDTAPRTAQFALDNDISTIQLLSLVPIPGSRLYKKIEKENRILTRDWSRYDGHSVVFLPKRMTPNELQESIIRAMTSFYSFRSALRSFLKFDFSIGLYRLAGKHIIRNWMKENTNWLARIEKWQEIFEQSLNDLQNQI